MKRGPHRLLGNTKQYIFQKKAAFTFYFRIFSVVRKLLVWNLIKTHSAAFPCKNCLVLWSKWYPTAISLIALKKLVVTIHFPEVFIDLKCIVSVSTFIRTKKLLLQNLYRTFFVLTNCGLFFNSTCKCFSVHSVYYLMRQFMQQADGQKRIWSCIKITRKSLVRYLERKSNTCCNLI